jgi:transglutaminase-like putative cysteine protease
MRNISLFAILIFICFTLKTSAQNINFGSVSKQELEETVYPLDSTAPAAFIYKKRRSYYDYVQGTGFILITKIHERIKIYNKEGLEWAKKVITIYKNNSAHESVSIKGYTYNLVKGKISRVKLKSKLIFKEKINEHWTSYKFTMSNVSVGSVVEWTYNISSPFIGNINDVIFQYKIPVKKIVAKVEIPEYFTFKYQPNFYYPIKFTTSKKDRTIRFINQVNTTRNSDYMVSRKTSNSEVRLEDLVYTSTELNVPAIKEEPLINNINNYIAKVHFEHTSTQYPNSYVTNYGSSWGAVTEAIYKSSNFGRQLANTGFLKNDVAALDIMGKSDQEKAMRLFQFVKSKIKWNGLYGKYTDKGLKKAYQEHAGNVADINLTLVALLREAGLKANPVLVSTRSHGIPLFPTSDGFNYVIAALEFQTGYVLFDATEIFSMPNVLPKRTLNWHGRLVRSDGSSSSINLFSAKPAKSRVILYAKIDTDGTVTGLKRSSYFSNFALNYRKTKAFLAKESLQSRLEEAYDGIEISDLKVSNKKEIYKPLVESFKFLAEDYCDVINDKIYFSPLLFLAMDKNPFKLEKRTYPIDFGSKWEKNYTISIKIPDGYSISTLPQNKAIGLPENMGSFKYIITKNGENKIQVLTSVKINKSIVPYNYYTNLKDFYKQLIEKQTEKVVLTKL